MLDPTSDDEDFSVSGWFNEDWKHFKLRFSQIPLTLARRL